MTDGDGLDEAFRTATKLRICAFLSACDEAEFRSVQEYCELTPPALSKNVSALEEVGYVSVRKGYVGRRPRTWLALTEEGASALAGHLGALRKIADDAAAHARRR
ncbi:transcriptional regulator [Kitasatospora sp. Ki12]|uniref:transcriptional regulator n=1 Tax=Kitasatospora xanthocidica TaxID=83382 RepID=UPI001679C173|nr:transcriptional regulator [Kitasatospora xanthocidica]GHF64542.1 transcriptional regulator [Kitasatospora xanthocidica]